MVGRWLMVAVAAVVLVGCTAQKAEKLADKRQDEATKHMSAASESAQRVDQDSLIVSPSLYVGGDAVRLKKGRPLPVTVEGLRSVAFNEAVPQTLQQVGELIAERSGIPVRVADLDLPNSQNSRGREASRDSTGEAAVGVGGGFDSQSRRRIPVMQLKYEGPVSGALDMVSAHFGVSWRYDGTAITLFRYETRTFTIEAAPGTQSATDGLTGGSVGGTTGGSLTGAAAAATSNSSTQTTQMDAKVDFWADLKGTLDTLLAGVGVYQVAPSTGTVTVVTTHDRMQEVAGYLEAENRRLSKQVAITVEVWAVSFNDRDNYGLDLTAAFEQARGLGLNVSTPATGITGGGSLSVSVLEPASWTRLAKWNGSEAAFKMLSTVGRVGKLARVPFTALNSRPATRKITVDKTYVGSSTGGTVSNGVVTNSSLTPAVTSTGLVMQVLPRIYDDGRITLRYSLQLAENKAIDKETAGDQLIQLPTDAKNLFVQEVQLRSGSTMVISGYDQTVGSVSGKGVGSGWNPIFGAIDGTIGREMIVIVITPVEVSLPRGEPR